MNTLSRFARLAAIEPFRAFFPLGMLLGIIGIALWPMHYAGLIETYPLVPHIRLMIYGFLGCFVFGFLLTAGPRLIKAPRPPAGIVGSLVAISLLIPLALALQKAALADALFFGQLLLIVVLASVGFIKRKDMPPPGFILGIAGLLCALIGACLMTRLSLGHGTAQDYSLAKILLFQGFPMLPLIGIGAFFFPRLSGGKNTHDLPVNARPTRLWTRHALRAAAVALAFALSIPLELRGHDAAAYALRTLAITAYLFVETPIFRRNKPAGQQQLHLVLCFGTMVASFAAIASFPAYRIALLHGFFITALTGSILLVSVRVVLGHSGSFKLVMKSKKPLVWGILILLAGASTRVVADLWPQVRASHHSYAAIIWIAVAIAWMLLIAPKTRIPDPDDS